MLAYIFFFVFMANTLILQDLYDVSYSIIAQGQDSTAYPLTLMRSFLNKSQNDICYGNVQNLSTNERLEKQIEAMQNELNIFTDFAIEKQDQFIFDLNQKILPVLNKYKLK